MSIQRGMGMTSTGRATCITEFLFHTWRLKFCLPTSHPHCDSLKWLFVILVTRKDSLAHRRTHPFKNCEFKPLQSIYIASVRRSDVSCKNKQANQDFETNCETHEIWQKYYPWFFKDHWPPPVREVTLSAFHYAIEPTGQRSVGSKENRMAFSD